VTRTTVCACFPAALGAFDFGLLALAGPRIAPALGVTGAAYPWLFSASSFAYGAAVMPAAALTGRLGPPRVLALGLALAAAGAGTLAGSSGLVTTLAARAVFGVGGALAATAALALLAAVADGAGRSAGFAMLGGAVAAGFAGGALLAAVDQWRPVLLAACVAALVVALASARLPSAARERPGVMPGTARLTAAIVLAAAAIAAAETGGWAALPLAASLALALAALRQAATWLHPGGVRFAAACLAGAATTATGVGATILIGPALTAERLPTALLGLFGLGVLPGTWLAHRLAASAGPATAASAGIALQGLALTAVAVTFAMGAPLPAVAAALVCFGVAHVVANAGAAAAALMGPASAPSAALLIAAQYVGGGVGPLATTAVAAAHGFAPAVLAAAAVALVSAIPLGVARGAGAQPVACR
jgi:MFS family permease